VTSTVYPESTTIFKTCAITGPSGGIEIRVTNATKSVADALITVQDISHCGAGPSPMVVAQYDVTTNATGWAWICAEYDGTCSLTIHFSGMLYPLSVPLEPGLSQYVRYDLSTGNETVGISP
jgi:hypothetical protein